MLIPDASVVCKWYFDEVGALEADAVLRTGGLIAPDSLVSEFTNAVSRRVRMGLLPLDAAARMMAHMPRQFVRLFPSAALAGRALEMSVALNHPSYDCVYLALAEREQGTLVTDDMRFYDKAAGSEWGEFVIPLRTAGESRA